MEPSFAPNRESLASTDFSHPPPHIYFILQISGVAISKTVFYFFISNTQDRGIGGSLFVYYALYYNRSKLERTFT